MFVIVVNNLNCENTEEGHPSIHSNNEATREANVMNLLISVENKMYHAKGVLNFQIILNKINHTITQNIIIIINNIIVIISVVVAVVVEY